IPSTEAAGTPARFPALTSAAKLTTSGQKSPLAVADEEHPSSSRDRSFYFGWWPAGTATSGWIEYAFDKLATGTESEMHWFDDAAGRSARTGLVAHSCIKMAPIGSPSKTQAHGRSRRTANKRASSRSRRARCAWK